MTSAAGHDASRPGQIPARGWKQVAGRVTDKLREDHVSLLAAGVAFRGLLALFPALIATISIWGLLTSPDEVTEQLEGLTAAMPGSAQALVTEQMESIAGDTTGTLGLALAISVLVALWSASAGMVGLMDGTTVAHDERERRGPVTKRAVALLLTLGAIVFLIVSLSLLTALPAMLDRIGLGETATLVIGIARWPLLALLMIVGLSVVYRYGPDRTRPRLRWATWGAVVAAVLWLIGSWGFSLFVENFGTFGETYGVLAGVVILMLWLFVSAWVVLLGASINAEMERQTLADTTIGDPRPLGARGAVPADTVPEDVERHQV